jgi:HK97 family phage major capsid protein
MNIKALRQEKADLEAATAALKAEARRITAVAVADRTPEQSARLDAIDKDLDAKAELAAVNAKELARAERYAAEEKRQGDPNIALGTDHAAEKPWGPEIAANAPKHIQDEARHIALGNFAIAVKSHALGQGADPRLFAAATGAGTQVDSNLGFAVPREVAPGIEREMFGGGELLSRADTRTITVGNSIAYNLIDQTSRADSSRGGGVLGYWVDEGVAPTTSNTKLSRMEMKLRKVGAFGVMTDELMSDAAALGGELESAFADELIFQVENKMYRGNGANAPQGILNAPCLVSVAKETGQAASTIVYENLIKMWARVSPRAKSNAVWTINTDCGPQLHLLAQTVGTAALPARFVSYDANGNLQIFGRPVIEVEYAETVGTVGDIAVCDWKKYRLIRKGGVEQASSMHVYFAQGEQAFRAFYRVDGQAVPRAALTPFKGSNTLSPFVVLATRS